MVLVPSEAQQIRLSRSNGAEAELNTNASPRDNLNLSGQSNSLSGQSNSETSGDEALSSLTYSNGSSGGGSLGSLLVNQWSLLLVVLTLLATYFGPRRRSLRSRPWS